MNNFDYRKDWFWEGKVQDKIVNVMKTEEFKVFEPADTRKKAHGPDIEAVDKKGKKWIVEVKGYPPEKCTQGPNKGQSKSDSKLHSQAKMWFSRAVMKVVLDKGDNPELEIAIGLPKHPEYYDELIKKSEWLFKKIGLYLYLVDKEGKVTVKHYHE